MNQSVKIEMHGKDGIFRTEKSLTLFITHETRESIKVNLSAVKKEIVKLLKSGECSIDLLTMDSGCRTDAKWRFIPQSYAWRDAFELDCRYITSQNDFSNSEKLNFTTQNEQMKYLMKQITAFVDQTMGELPEDKSWYSRKLDNEYIPEDILAFCN